MKISNNNDFSDDELYLILELCIAFRQNYKDDDLIKLTDKVRKMVPYVQKD